MADKIYRTREAYEQHKQNIIQAKKDLHNILRAKADTVIHDDGNEDLAMKESIARVKLRNLEKELDKIIIIDSNNENDVVGIGNIVTLKITSNGNCETCKIKLIASTITNWDLEVSINGPLGQAIVSKKINDEVSYKVEDTLYHVKILNIE